VAVARTDQEKLRFPVSHSITHSSYMNALELGAGAKAVTRRVAFQRRQMPLRMKDVTEESQISVCRSLSLSSVNCLLIDMPVPSTSTPAGTGVFLEVYRIAAFCSWSTISFDRPAITLSAERGLKVSLTPVQISSPSPEVTA